MARAPLVLVESSLEERVEHTFENYILDALSERQACYGADEGFEDFSDYLRQSLYNIRRRLGGERYNTLQTMLTNALDAHRCGDPGGHRVWIEILLRDYYDPMYSYQLKQKQDRVIFAGESVEVLEYLQKENLHAEMA